MPQLDITGYSTQLFWVGLILFLTYMVIYSLVLPHMLRLLRYRNEFLNNLQSDEWDNTALNKQLQNDLLELLTELRTVKTNYNYLNDKTFVLDLKSIFLKQKLLSFTTSVLHSNDKKQLGVFLSLLTPSDEFILMISFIVFIIILFIFVYNIILANIDSQLSEIKNRILTLIRLKKQYLSSTYKLLETISLLQLDEQNILSKYITKLDESSNVSHNTFSNSQLGLSLTLTKTQLTMNRVENIQNILFSIAKNKPSFLNDNQFIDLPFTKDSIKNVRLLEEAYSLSPHKTTPLRLNYYIMVHSCDDMNS